jgi:tetratricopeptide (TPR) repeat protein
MLGWARHQACPEDASAGEPELRRALLLDPDDEYALYYLGRLLGARGEVDAARQLLRSALEKNHEFDLAREALKELDS